MAKPLPANLEAERSVLGILLLGDEEPWDEAAGLIREGDFFQPAHKTIFLTIKELRQMGQPSDVVTAANALKKKGVLEQVGGAVYLSELINELPSASNILAYANIVKEKALLREVIRLSESFIDRAHKESYKKIEHFIDSLEADIFRLYQRQGQAELAPLADLVEPGIEKLESLYHKKLDFTGLSSGFADLDNITSGFQPSELTVIAARPSMGKTAFSLNIALNIALQGLRASSEAERKNVAFFSLEMSKEQVLLRLLSSHSQTNLSHLMTGQVGEKRWGKLIAAAGDLSRLPFYVDDSSLLSPYDIRAKARRLKARQGLDLIVVDYLQLMQLLERAENRQIEVSEISRLLKSLAKELNIPIIALSQLNRGVEGRSNRRPLLSDLRESGAIEQDADVIMMLYREDYYRKSGAIEDESENPGQAEIIISKNRNGPTGTAHLRWVPEYASFANNPPSALLDSPPLPPIAPPSKEDIPF